MNQRQRTDTEVLPVYLVRGDTASLVAQEVRNLLDRLLGDRDPALVVEEHGGGTDELEVGAVVDACATPPFLVDRRIVVLRDAGRIVAADVPLFKSVLEHPMTTNVLVLVGGGGTVPVSLVKVISSVGEVIDLSMRSARDKNRWLEDHMKGAPVKLSGEASRRLSQHIGEDLGRLDGIFATLVSTYGPGANVGEAEVEPFLGDEGGIPPWGLTDPIDQGDMEGALRMLGRMIGAGGRDPVQVIDTLRRHFAAMLRLEGSGARSEEEALAALGGGQAFVAKKALAQANRLGSEKVGQAVTLVADADLDVKGRSGLPAEAVLEILVARLSRLSRQRMAATRRR